jgi:plasmid replication initiation protein
MLALWVKPRIENEAMTLENPNPESQLVPDRYPQHDLFICDVADAVLKDVMAHMEHPFYSLSKKPETGIRRYEHNGHWLEVVPSVKGLATIYDKDILIYCISQVMAKLRQGDPIAKRVRVNSRELLQFTNRGTAGKDYQALSEALYRLGGTQIRTNIITGKEEQIDTFALIESSSIRRQHGLDGRLIWCDVTLSDWVFNAIKSHEVLTLHRDYFRLRKPIERRVYELARKHCGQQENWKCSLDLLHKKSGSKSDLREFRRAIKHLAEHDHLPDYRVEMDNAGDTITFINRNTMNEKALAVTAAVPPLASSTYEKARAAAPSWDIYHLENEWRSWTTEPPRNADAAFIGFCKKWFERNGRA